MKIISYNIQYGKGMDGEFDLVRTCKRIRAADIICLQEVEQGWRPGLSLAEIKSAGFTM